MLSAYFNTSEGNINDDFTKTVQALELAEDKIRFLEQVVAKHEVNLNIFSISSFPYKIHLRISHVRST